MRLYKKILIVALALSSLSSLAQDIHFTMFNLSPLSLNPANTGLMNADFRIANSFRSQWRPIGDPVNTVAASYDQQLYSLPNNISGGLIFINDQAGGIDLVENKLMGSLGIKRFGRKATLSGGVQIGLASKVFRSEFATYPQQYSRELGTFDPDLPSGEEGMRLSTLYLDVNIGGIVQFKTRKGPLTIGGAIFHVNAPDESFYKTGDRLLPRLVSHAEYDLSLTEKIFIRPAFIWMTLQKAQELVVGSAVGVRTKGNSLNVTGLFAGMNVRTGVNRNGDAFAPYAGIDFKHFKVGVVYDITYSDLQIATDRRGAIEFAVIYTSPYSAATKVTIPCERY
ncbi:MAG: PorP/SprF family type IX secretion system membrane protein [Flavobacteriales bacterium]